jgi:RNA polymerase-binding transcription factor DksA
MELDLTIYRQKLTTEKEHLTEELNSTGLADPHTPGQWQAGVSEMGESDFREDVADRLEEFQEREATEVNLEKRFRDVTTALEKIETGTYGSCEICNQPIEEERLEANPAARTCKTHIDQEDTLV